VFSTAGSLLQARAAYGAVMRQVVAQHELDRRLRREDEIRSAATALLHALSGMSARAFSPAEQRALRHDQAETADDLPHGLTASARETRSLVLVYEDLLDDEAVDRVLEACAVAADLPFRPESLGTALERIDLAMRTLKAVKRGTRRRYRCAVPCHRRSDLPRGGPAGRQALSRTGSPAPSTPRRRSSGSTPSPNQKASSRCG
jgi:hypothetical protein